MRRTERDIPESRRGISAAGQKDEAGEIGLVSCSGRPQDPYEHCATLRALSAFRRAWEYWACLSTYRNAGVGSPPHVLKSPVIVCAVDIAHCNVDGTSRPRHRLLCRGGNREAREVARHQHPRQYL